jgi:hypothetical protein
MKKRYSTKLSWALAILLLAGAILGVALIGERVLAAMLDAWKFAQTGPHGIDLGARSGVQFLFLCLLGASGCLGVSRFHPGKSGRFTKIILSAGVLYLSAGAAVVSMVSLGAAYLYCGR